MGMMHQVMIGGTFEHENNEGCAKGDLGFFRDTSGGENDDGRDEVEKVIIYQGSNRRFKVNWLRIKRKFYA